jgi:hypothetical protein
MKIISRVFLGFAILATVAITACEDSEGKALSGQRATDPNYRVENRVGKGTAFQPPQEKVISTKAFVIRFVQFVNSNSEQLGVQGTAITRVFIKKQETAPMLSYDFPGYHPEITAGQTATHT